MSSELLLRLSDVSKVFKLEAGLFASSRRYVWAVNSVSLDINRGETYGLVGESGSGKTTLARTIVQLVPHSEGKIEYFPSSEADGSDADGSEADGTHTHGAAIGSPWTISTDDAQLLKSFRADVKYIFQDPSSSLDPRMNVFRVLTTGARYSPRFANREDIRRRTIEVMEAVGLREADLERRPSEFSGGQRQRISLARALLSNPTTLICDEVVSALDVSIQGQILNLLVDLKSRFNLTMLFIAHDLTVVSYMADRIGVLYGGGMMEEAPAASLVERPLHPYTQLLYNSVPQLGKPLPDRAGTPGQPYNPTRPPQGCPFAGRCPMVQEVCRDDTPELREVAPGHRVACHFVR